MGRREDPCACTGVKKSLIIQLVLLGVVVGAIAMVVAFFIPWLPPLASTQGKRIDDVYVLTSVICLCLFAIVAAVLLYSVVKFRARPGDDEDGKPIHGNTGLEIFWTAVPAALVTVIAIYSGIVLTRNDHLPANHRVIQVTAQQFAWSFTYPDLGITTGVLRVPENQTIDLQMKSKDVIHSFWVPDWRVKQDVVPGTTQHIVVTPNKLGTFPLICTELCGLGHAYMRTTAVVLTQSGFDKWVKEQKSSAAGGGGNPGQQVFVNAGCGACHTLAAAGSTGKIGPDLDKVLPGMTADEIRTDIIDPNATITPGYQPNVMPGTFGDQLSKEQLDALVKYLQDSAGKGQG